MYVIGKCHLVIFAVKRFWALQDNIYSSCYNHCLGNAVMGFWALRDNTYDECVLVTTAMVMLLMLFWAL
jgi:hypothetical protein